MIYMFDITPMQNDPSKVLIEADITTLTALMSFVKGNRESIAEDVVKFGISRGEADRVVNSIFNDYSAMSRKTRDLYKIFLDQCCK